MKRVHGLVKGVLVAPSVRIRTLESMGQSREAATLIVGSFEKAEVSHGGVNGVYGMRLVRSKTNVTYFVR